jgi:hypothetical protein
MSRFVDPLETGEQDFAAFLERLTGKSSAETGERDSGAYFTPGDRSGKASSAPSSAVASSRAKSRPLAPATELKAGKHAAELEGVQLSYEKALRIHARHRQNSEHNLPKTEPAKSPQVDSTTVTPAMDVKPGGTTLPNPTGSKTAKKVKPAKTQNGLAQTQRKPKAKAAPPSTARSKNSQANHRRHSNQEDSDTYLQRLQPPVLQQELQLSHRRSVVSVRLTDLEFARLRDRASESGISVSAYMRSCVLDAEILRAQVKQALAEMRTLTAHPEPVRVPAIAASRSTTVADGGEWFRFFQRSAAYLLSPFFQFRRSTRAPGI